MKDVILVINSGSSSLKFSTYAANDRSREPILAGKFIRIGIKPALEIFAGPEEFRRSAANIEIPQNADHGTLIELLLEILSDQILASSLGAIGHRVVHGGLSFYDPVLLTREICDKLQDLTPLAPMHQPHNVAAINAFFARSPQTPQVACFDTGFHQTQSALNRTYAIPRTLSARGIKRYGFHGLSYQYITSVLPDFVGDDADGKYILAHLGNGASMCAVHHRQSIATTMGFSTLEGLMMGRRCGAIDPGILLYLLREDGLSLEELEHLLYRESGLLGASGISNNMRILLESNAPEATEAIDLYCYRAAGLLASLIVSMGGLDGIVFTAGIGENSPQIRAKICEHLPWLGVHLDPLLNERNQSRIEAGDSAVKLLVIPTDEESVIADAVRRLVFSQDGSG